MSKQKVKLRDISKGFKGRAWYQRSIRERKNKDLRTLRKEGLRLLAKIAKEPSKHINRVTATTPSFHYYPEFRVFSLTGDGFPTAKFVVSGDNKELMCVQLRWKDNEKLFHMGNPEKIPYVFPIEDLVKHLKKIKV
jgi:hypothetical protein